MGPNVIENHLAAGRSREFDYHRNCPVLRSYLSTHLELLQFVTILPVKLYCPGTFDWHKWSKITCQRSIFIKYSNCQKSLATRDCRRSIFHFKLSSTNRAVTSQVFSLYKPCYCHIWLSWPQLFLCYRLVNIFLVHFLSRLSLVGKLKKNDYLKHIMLLRRLGAVHLKSQYRSELALFCKNGEWSTKTTEIRTTIIFRRNTKSPNACYECIFDRIMRSAE